MITDKEIDKCYESLIGVVPAFVAEIIDRAKSYMVAGGRTSLTGEDIISAADSYKHQQELSRLRPKDNPNEVMGKMLKKFAHMIMDPRLIVVDNPEIRAEQIEE